MYYDYDQLNSTLDFGLRVPAPPIDNNKRLGHLSRADNCPAGKAGNEDCLLDEEDEPQVD